LPFGSGAEPEHWPHALRPASFSVPHCVQVHAGGDSVADSITASAASGTCPG